mmetsp:Transcript_8389/g.1132  ORF Transcript_8389/g.1132 Transcript_8389/m.1132 type:complete len:124 (+) Transcript_8389:22-393(+)
MVKVKAYELRKQTDADLLKNLENYKSELAQSRVAKVSGGGAAKLHKIRVFRKNIARTLTILHERKRLAAKEKFAESKYKPLDLRPKLTRKLRLALSKEDRNKLTARVQKAKMNFPQRSFSVVN